MDKLAAPLVDWYCAHQGRPWRRPRARSARARDWCCARSRLVGRGDPAFRGIDFKYPCTRQGAKLAAPISIALLCVFFMIYCDVFIIIGCFCILLVHFCIYLYIYKKWHAEAANSNPKIEAGGDTLGLLTRHAELKRAGARWGC